MAWVTALLLCLGLVLPLDTAWPQQRDYSHLFSGDRDPVSALKPLIPPLQTLVDEDISEKENDSSTDSVPNFRLVSPGIYRSGYPTDAGLIELVFKIQLKTILTLRRDNTVKKEKEMAEHLGITLENVPMGNIPSFEQVDKALAILTNSNTKRPILVHGRVGRDRTGVIIAAYRVVIEGMDPAAAFAEARQHGNLSVFLRNLDKFLIKYREHYRIAHPVIPPNPTPVRPKGN